MESRSKTNELFQQLKIISEMPTEKSIRPEWQKFLNAGPPPRQRAAICICFSGNDFLNSSVLLTMRSSELPTHASQVAFPGGSIEPQDENDFIRAALRECSEEVGFSPKRSEVVGQLPSIPTFTGNFEVVPVLAAISHPIFPSLRLSDEVTVAEWVSVKTLTASRRDEKRVVEDIEVSTPYFMWGERKMWGLSAWIFDLILNRYDTIKG
jgi:8-oxo-dGTP pyrophosphatase MutT (NUDIX family)